MHRLGLQLPLLLLALGCASSPADDSGDMSRDPEEPSNPMPEASMTITGTSDARTVANFEGGAESASSGRDAAAPDARSMLDATPLPDARSDGGPSTLVTIGNTKPRTDVSGAIVDAHDGCLMRFGSGFYLYGTSYGTTDGFGQSNRYRVYSSPDLMTWQPRGDLLSGAPAGVYYRPYVIFNSTTHKYVLWYNWYATLWNGQFGVATSDKPEGPFAIVNDNVKVVNSGPGDESLFVDDDGSAYLIYTSIDKGHGISIEKLSSDYQSSTMTSSGVLASGVEAPALFKRGSTYYALFDGLCSFCGGGSGATVRTAQSPLGPYTVRSDINRSAGNIVVPAQQTFIAQIPTVDGIAYLWMGDLWGSRPDGVKGHDLQYWSPPLVFDGSGMITTMTKTDSFALRIP